MSPHEERWREVMAGYHPAATDEDWSDMQQLLSITPKTASRRRGGWAGLALLLLLIAWVLYPTRMHDLVPFPIAERPAARSVTVTLPLPVTAPDPLSSARRQPSLVTGAMSQPLPRLLEYADTAERRTASTVRPLPSGPPRPVVRMGSDHPLQRRLPVIQPSVRKPRSRQNSYYPPTKIRQ